MNELLERIENFIKNFSDLFEKIDIEGKQIEIKKLENEMAQEGFWDDSRKAQKISQKLADIKEEVNDWEGLNEKLKELYKITKESEESKMYDLKEEIESDLKKQEKIFDRLESQALLNDPYDRENALLSIQAGAGGTDAQDWAEILLRMYLRFFENKGFLATILDRSDGAEAGIKSINLEVRGKMAYGTLKGESGVHRLVRISPFDAEKMRHTSFAMVEVMPEMDEVEVDMKDDELEITTAKASGPGGQGVNTTDSAVRMKHVPTGIVVTCKNERSQLQNKETALKILKSKLYQYLKAEQEEERKRIKGEYTEAAWGNQIRSYVLHPYKMVKDHRTKYETQDTDRVLDGEIDDFITEYLKSEV